jgi:hypothetical protein
LVELGINTKQRRFSLNAQNFALAGPVRMKPIPVRSQKRAAAGKIVRSDNIKLDRLRYKWNLGIGWHRLDRETGRGVGGFRDSGGVDTRFSVMELALLHETQTHSGQLNHLVRYVHYLGNFWGIFERDYATGNTGTLYAAIFGASNDTYASGVQVGGANVSDDNEGVRAWDAVEGFGYLFVLQSGADPDGDETNESAETRYSISKYDGSNVTIAMNAGANPFDGTIVTTTTHTRRNNFDDDHGKMVVFQNRLIIAVFDSANSQIEIWYSANPTAGTPTYTAGAVIASKTGPRELLDWKTPLVSPPTPAVTLVTQDAVYRVDHSSNTYDKIYELDGYDATGHGAVVGQDGDLYIGLNSTGQIIGLHAQPTGGLQQRIVGPPGDGLVTAHQGTIKHIIAPPLPWLFVAYGGQAADKKASIFAIEYAQHVDPDTNRVFHPWHSIYEEANANIDLYQLGYSARDDGAPRLHFALEHASSSEMYHLEHVAMSGFASGAARKTQASGFIEFAEEDFGDPHTNSAVFQGLIDADDLTSSTSGEYVQWQWGADGAAYTANDGGDFLSSDKDLILGTNGVGESAKTFRNRLDLKRDDGDTSQGPKVKDFELQARNKVQTLWRFEIPIDISATARNEDIEPETVISRLDTIKNNVALLRFVFGEDGAGAAQTFNVEMHEDTNLEVDFVAPESIDQGADIDPTERSGRGILVLEEVY